MYEPVGCGTVDSKLRLYLSEPQLRIFGPEEGPKIFLQLNVDSCNLWETLIKDIMYHCGVTEADSSLLSSGSPLVSIKPLTWLILLIADRVVTVNPHLVQ